MKKARGKPHELEVIKSEVISLNMLRVTLGGVGMNNLFVKLIDHRPLPIVVSHISLSTSKSSFIDSDWNCTSHSTRFWDVFIKFCNVVFTANSFWDFNKDNFPFDTFRPYYIYLCLFHLKPR